MNFRVEKDSLGEVKVPADRYWGAQTQRSLEHFNIALAHFRWQRPIVRALGLVKCAAAKSNAELEQLDTKIAKAIIEAAEEVVEGKLNAHFPLGVFQTGSGTHSNMNVNEVIANRAIELLGGKLGTREPVHPNDHVNLGQSSNDVFPTVMHIAVLEMLQDFLLPSIQALKQTFDKKSADYKTLVKTGRTHLQDAAPLTLGQEVSAWSAQLQFALQQIEHNRQNLFEVAIGGTAVGTGLNAHPQFGETVARHLRELTGIPFSSAPNKFFTLATHDPLVELSASLRTLAMGLLKIANDVRWLASGPRSGLGELKLPQNEPGSSIMPGKVNPTQCEALSMVCVQVFGNDASVAFAGSQGNFQLNAYKPVMVHNVMESVQLLADASYSFNKYCAQGLTADEDKIELNLRRNLMLVTALNKHVGYDKAAQVAKFAEAQDLTLLEACLELGVATQEQFEEWIDPLTMTQNK